MENTVTERSRHYYVSKVVKKVDGDLYRFRLGQDGVTVRKHRPRKFKVVPFSMLVDLTIDQKPLL